MCGVATAESRHALGSVAPRWGHRETRSPVCWGPRSEHEPSPMGDGRAVMGSSGEHRAGSARGSRQAAEGGWCGGCWGSHLYRLYGNMDDGPRLGGVFVQFVRDWRPTGCRRFGFRRRLRGLLPVGTRVRLSPPPPRARDRIGERGPRSAADSHLTMGMSQAKVIAKGRSFLAAL